MFSKSGTSRAFLIAIACTIFAACSNNDDSPSQASTPAPAAPVAQSLQPQGSSTTDSSSDIQRWAALQTQPAAAQPAAPAPASNGLLPPVIHTVD